MELPDQTNKVKLLLRRIPRHILPVIVLAQFCCTSLWFASNAVLEDLSIIHQLSTSSLGHLTSSVQFGFIIGTLVFAFLTISDRFSPSKVFFVCALLGALFNLGILLKSNSYLTLLSFRFATGFCLAGIYPVGMKIASDYFDKGLGKSLGYLVGALVLGTAFPHLIKGFSLNLSWHWVIISTSTLAFIGGLSMVVTVPDGPYRRASQQLDLSAFVSVFKQRKFRIAAFGYFGHMWELYAFWAFVPVILASYTNLHSGTSWNHAILSFAVIGLGSASCVIAGYWSINSGTKRVAQFALFSSCICCLVSPLVFHIGVPWVFLLFLFFWGLVVIADSPLFSTLVALNAPSEIKGTALTIVNCIGFFITIFSIQLLTYLIQFDVINVFAILAVGPIMGLIALWKE